MTVLAPLREEDFQQQIIELARMYGWRVAHFRAAQTARGWRTPVAADGAGFPDLVLVRDAELIFAELKTDRGRLRPDQGVWIAAFEQVAVAVTAAVGALEGLAPGLAPNVLRPAVDVYLWRPCDFDEIHGRLARGRLRSAA
jgi:hypothetical protein